MTASMQPKQLVWRPCGAVCSGVETRPARSSKRATHQGPKLPPLLVRTKLSLLTAMKSLLSLWTVRRRVRPSRKRLGQRRELSRPFVRLDLCQPRLRQSSSKSDPCHWRKHGLAKCAPLPTSLKRSNAKCATRSNPAIGNVRLASWSTGPYSPHARAAIAHGRSTIHICQCKILITRCHEFSPHMEVVKFLALWMQTEAKVEPPSLVACTATPV